MADVIAFMLELATLSSHCLKYISYILERVPEDIVVAAENIGLLPIMLPLGDALGRIEESKVDTSHVQRAHFRSEEHTSELQSLMRNSYAVFCLKKKNNRNIQYHYNNTSQVKNTRN